MNAYAIEALKLGHGGICFISKLLECDPKTLLMGLMSWRLKSNSLLSGSEKKGGGRKPLSVIFPQLIDNLLSVLNDHTAGDPMRQGLKWTNLSRRTISRKLEETSTPAGKNVVSRLLHKLGFRRRKPQKKRTMKQHADRNAQFENIARLKKEYLEAGKPVLSIDTKKKELLGNFYRDGVTDAIPLCQHSCRLF